MRSVKQTKGLQNSGYAVDAVYDGEAALHEYGVNRYDLIILDLNLPKVDGLDVLREIQKTNGSIKAIIPSARSKVNDRILGCSCRSPLRSVFLAGLLVSW